MVWNAGRNLPVTLSILVLFLFLCATVRVKHFGIKPFRIFLHCPFDFIELLTALLN